MSREAQRAMWLMAAFVLVWTVVEATAASLLKRYSPYQVVWTRYAVHLVLLALICGWRQPSRLWRTTRPGFQIARSLLMLVMPASWVVSTQWGVPMSTTMAVFWLAPLLIMGWAAIFLGERSPWWMWGLCALASLGGMVLFVPQWPPAPWLLAAPVAMAASFSLYIVMTRSLRTEGVRANLFYTALGVLLALTPFMPGLWITPGLADLARMAAVGALGLVGLWMVDRLAAAAPVSVSAPVCYLQLSATIVAAIALGHWRVDGQHLIALALVSLPAFLLARSAWPRRLPEPA